MFFVITGPSGSGKSVLLRRVMQEIDGLRFSVSHTTRPRRSLEKEGEDYYFLSLEDFKRKADNGVFLEWAEVHGHLYGTSREEIEKKGREIDVALDIDVQGARQIRASGREAVFIFIIPPGFEELKRRLESRDQDTKETILRRLRTAKMEVLEYKHFDFIVINDDLEEAVKELSSIIVSRRCLVAVRDPELQPILRSFQAREIREEEG